MWARCTRDVGEIWARCTRDVGEMWARYGGAVRLLHSVAAFGRFGCGCGFGFGFGLGLGSDPNPNPTPNLVDVGEDDVAELDEVDLRGRCGRDVGEMWARCGRDVGEIWARYEGDVGGSSTGPTVLLLSLSKAPKSLRAYRLGLGLGLGVRVRLRGRLSLRIRRACAPCRRPASCRAPGQG